MSGIPSTSIPIIDSLTGADARAAKKEQKGAEARWEQIYNELVPYLPTSQQLTPQYSYMGKPATGLLSSSYANELFQKPQQGMFFGDTNVSSDFLPGGGTLPDYGDYGDLGVPGAGQGPQTQGAPYDEAQIGKDAMKSAVRSGSYTGSQPPIHKDLDPSAPGWQTFNPDTGYVYTPVGGLPPGVTGAPARKATPEEIPEFTKIISNPWPDEAFEGYPSGGTGTLGAGGGEPVGKTNAWQAPRLPSSLLHNIEGKQSTNPDEWLAKQYGMTPEQIREISRKAGLNVPHISKTPPKAPVQPPTTTTIKGNQPQDYLTGRNMQEAMVNQLGTMANAGVSPSSQYGAARDASMSSMGNLQDLAKAGAPMSGEYQSARDASARGLKALEDLVSRGIDLSGDTYQQGLGAQNDYLSRVKALADNRNLSEADLAQLAKGARDIGTESSRQRAAVRSGAEARGVGTGLSSLADELLATQAGANQYGDLYANMQNTAQQRALNALKDYGLTSDSMRKQAFGESQAQRDVAQKSAESAAGYADRLRSGLASEEDMYGRRALDTSTAAADYANRVRSGLAGEEETYGRRALDTTTKAADFAQQLRDQAFTERKYDIDYMRKMSDTNAQTAKDLRQGDIDYLRGIQSTNYDLRNKSADNAANAIQQSFGNKVNIANLRAGLPQFQAQSSFNAGQNDEDRAVAYYTAVAKAAAGKPGAGAAGGAA